MQPVVLNIGVLNPLPGLRPIALFGGRNNPSFMHPNSVTDASSALVLSREGTSTSVRVRPTGEISQRRLSIAVVASFNFADIALINILVERTLLYSFLAKARFGGNLRINKESHLVP